MGEVKLPLWYLTEDQEQMKNLGMDIDTTESRQRFGYFYKIDCVVPYYDEKGKERSEIYAGSANFLSPLSVNEVRQLIKEAGI